MSQNNRMFLSVGIAGALSCTALLGVAVADDRDRNGDRHKEMSFTRMFPELPPFARRPMRHGIRSRSWEKKAASSTPWMT